MAALNRVDLKSAGWIFLAAFAINLVWEYLQYDLYIPIHHLTKTWYTLIGASILDAFYVLALFVIFYRFGLWVVLLLALILATSTELWALHFRIWQYTEGMPIIPLLKVGLSPALQLVTTSLIVWFLLLKRTHHA